MAWSEVAERAENVPQQQDESFGCFNMPTYGGRLLRSAMLSPPFYAGAAKYSDRFSLSVFNRLDTEKISDEWGRIL